MLCCDFKFSEFRDELFDELNISFPQEIKTAVLKRKSEFLAGRIQAQRAFSLLGSTETHVEIGPHRQPIWPLGFNGSISHSDRSAVALVAALPNLLIGVDIEKLIPQHVAESIAQQILSPRESRLIAASRKDYYRNLTIVYSAKETLFKALYPWCGNFLGFEDLELSGPPKDKSVSMRINSEITIDPVQVTDFQVHWRLTGGQVTTWLIQPLSRYASQKISI
ncbi:MAG: 4'-phosphopantetheinyl transferase superfamily protein [Dinoroseobacter sp.]|nr:4'-phosphopantetheinyl transferase superfamily protein [Dinoroseobacter sp.]